MDETLWSKQKFQCMISNSLSWMANWMNQTLHHLIAMYMSAVNNKKSLNLWKSCLEKELELVDWHTQMFRLDIAPWMLFLLKFCFVFLQEWSAHFSRQTEDHPQAGVCHEVLSLDATKTWCCFVNSLMAANPAYELGTNHNQNFKTIIAWGFRDASKSHHTPPPLSWHWICSNQQLPQPVGSHTEAWNLLNTRLIIF